MAVTSEGVMSVFASTMRPERQPPNSRTRRTLPSPKNSWLPIRQVSQRGHCEEKRGTEGKELPWMSTVLGDRLVAQTFRQKGVQHQG